MISRILAWTLLLIPGLPLTALGAPAEAAPNVLIVSIDTLRADRLGCYGYDRAQTPVLDKLAGESVRFENAYSTVPLTLPAHTSLFTGTYPVFHGVRDNAGYTLPEARTTLAETLQARGYRTGAFVGAFVLDSKFGLAQGFETYYDNFDLSQYENVSPGYIQRRGDAVVREALNWLAVDSPRPFFLWVHLYDPHDPYTPPEPFASAQAGRPYDGEIAFTDQVVGDLLQGVSRRDPGGNTLIVVVGDHGESLGEHQEQKHGLFIYNATLRIPLLIRLPGKQPTGAVVAAPVSLVDIFPTVLQLLGIDRGEAPEIQGRGLASLMLGKAGPPATGLYAESYYAHSQFGWSPLQAWVSGRYKYIQAPIPELFDLESDPGERENLASRRSALTTRFREELEQFKRRFSGNDAAAAAGPTDSETLRKLQSLGYVAQPRSVSPESHGELVDPKVEIDFYNHILDLFELSSAGKYQEAIPGYLKALKAHPSLKIVHYKLGQAYFFTGNYEGALRSFQKAIELGGEDALGTFDLAQTYFRLGQFHEAQVGFERTLQLDPEHYRARINLGVIYKNQGKLQEARVQFEEALEAAPEAVEALGNLGVIQALQGQPEKAVETLKKAIELRPRDARLHANLSTVYRRLGRAEDAQRELEEARRLNPKLFQRPGPP